MELWTAWQRRKGRLDISAAFAIWLLMAFGLKIRHNQENSGSFAAGLVRLFDRAGCVSTRRKRALFKASQFGDRVAEEYLVGRFCNVDFCKRVLQCRLRDGESHRPRRLGDMPAGQDFENASRGVNGQVERYCFAVGPRQ